MSKYIKSLLSFRLKYLPILSIYFANSLATFSSIAEVFWFKNQLDLTQAQIIAITIWIAIPWSMKIIIAQLIDSVKLFGSQRRSYTFLAAFLMLIGYIATILVANGHINNAYSILIFAGFLKNCGFVMQDLVADTLSREIVKTNQSEEDFKLEVANIQLLSRIAEIIGSAIAMTIAGIIAIKFSYAQISYTLPLIAMISLTGSLFIKIEIKTTEEKVKPSVIVSGAIYALFIALFTVSNFEYSQEAMLLIGIIIICVLLVPIFKEIESVKRKEIICIFIALFACRSVPTYFNPPGIEWWQIDVLGFTPDFFATLNQISIFLSLIGLALLAKRVMNYNLGLILLAVNALHALLQLPVIAMAFGFHEWTMLHFGFGAKTIALIDNTAEGPFTKLNFFILCTVVTYYAPKHNTVGWFALVMSLMNLAYAYVAQLIQKFLSNIYIIERGKYDNVPDLLITTNLINFLVPTIAILLFINPFKKNAYGRLK